MKKGFAMVLISSVVFVLCGCAELSQSSRDQAVSQLHQRSSASFSDPRLNPIKNCAPYYSNDPGTPSSLPDTCPSDEQKIAINLLRDKIKTRRADMLEVEGRFSFYDTPVHMEFMTKADAYLGKLYRCEMTFQQYAEAYNTAVNEAEQKALVAKRDESSRRNREADEAAAYVSDMAFKQQLLYELGKKN